MDEGIKTSHDNKQEKHSMERDCAVSGTTYRETAGLLDEEMNAINDEKHDKENNATEAAKALFEMQQIDPNLLDSREMVFTELLAIKSTLKPKIFVICITGQETRCFKLPGNFRLQGRNEQEESDVAPTI